MPLYEYTDLRTGTVVEKLVPLTERDRVPGHKRNYTPLRFAPSGQREDPNTQAAQVLNGYKQLEERGELKRSEFTADQIKQAWSN